VTPGYRPGVTSLPELRGRIDEVDRAIVELLARRLDVCREVATV
jgi:chorismate mutase